MGNASIPAANISDISGLREGTNVVNEVVSGFDGVGGDGEAQEIDSFFCKLVAMSPSYKRLSSTHFFSLGMWPMMLSMRWV